MQRLRQRFGGLYWRLTLSYFFVTIIAAIIIETALTVQPAISELSQSRDLRQFAEMVQQQDTAQLTPYLDQTTPNQQALQDTAMPALTHAITGEPKMGPVILIAVADRDGRILASSDPCLQAALTAGTVVTKSCGNTLMQELTQALTSHYPSLRNALTGNREPASWITGIGGSTLIAVPIWTADGSASVGALIVALYGQTNVRTYNNFFWSFIGVFFDKLHPYGLYFVLLATALGTLTGLLITRNVTRRLSHITQAAEAWSKGDFAAAAPISSRDEIGQLAQDLNGMAAQIQTLLATREALAVVEERNRLARDLHDSVKQHIFANALLINAARNLLEQHPDQVSTHLEEAEHLAQLAQDELATLIRALRPAALADKGLAAVLRDYADEWSARMGIAVSLHIAGERPTPLAIEESLLRVTQEALTNVARHSGAAHVTITLEWQDDAISMTLSDDGHGFHVQHAPLGVGLKSMHERVTAVQGTFALSSAATGTTIQATIPLGVAPATT